MSDPFIAQLGRISGKLLQENLTRSTNLSFRNGPTDNDLLYIDVETRRIGINVDAPTKDLEVVGAARTTDNVLVTGTKATIDNIIIGTDNIFRTVVGPISIETTDPSTTFLHGQLLTDELDFNGQSIKSRNTNQSIILDTSGTGKVELLANTSITGNLFVSGMIRGRQNIEIAGQFIIGDSPIDTVAIRPDFTQGIVPGLNNSFDLGSLSRRWDLVQLQSADNVNQFISDGFVVSNQLRVAGTLNTISSTQSNDEVRLVASSGNIFLESFKIEDIEKYEVEKTGLYAEDDGAGGVRYNTGTGASFNDTGTIVFVLTEYATVRAYPLAVAYDPSTIGDENSYSERNLIGLGGLASSVATGGLFFKPDGTRFYVGGSAGGANRRVFQYDLAVAWNISTASFSGALGTLYGTTTLHKPCFSPDGTKLIVGTGVFDNTFAYYELTTAWNIAGGVTFSSAYTLSSASFISSFAFSDDGFTIYVNSSVDEFKIIKLDTAFRPTGGTILDAGISNYQQIESEMKVYNGIFYTSGAGGFQQITITDNPVKLINQLNTPVEYRQTGIGYLSIIDRNGFVVPSGSREQRQNLEVGNTRWNTTDGYLECFDGTVWQVSTGGGAVVATEDMEELGRLYTLILG